MIYKKSALNPGNKKALAVIGDSSQRIRGRIGDIIYQATWPQFANDSRPGDPNRMTRTQAQGTNPGNPDQLIQQGNIRQGNVIWAGFSAAEKDRFISRRSSVEITNQHGRRGFTDNGFCLWMHVYHRIILTGGNLNQWLIDHPVKPRRPKKRW